MSLSNIQGRSLPLIRCRNLDDQVGAQKTSGYRLSITLKNPHPLQRLEKKKKEKKLSPALISSQGPKLFANLYTIPQSVMLNSTIQETCLVLSEKIESEKEPKGQNKT